MTTLPPGSCHTVGRNICVGPDLVDSVSTAVLEQLADIRATGVPANEFSLFSNEPINDEVLDALVDPAGTASFDAFLQQDGLLGSISRNDITGFVQRRMPNDHYIEIRVSPRS